MNLESLEYVSEGAIPLVVTTERRGVFFGYGQPTTGETIRLERARMAVYWSADVRGVIGLAVMGPSDGCRIGPAAPAVTLRGVTAVLEASPEAAVRWERAPWCP